MSLENNNSIIEQNNALIETLKTKVQNIQTGSGDEPVKLFKSLEEMNNTTNLELGTLGLVYGDDTHPVKQGDIGRFFNFPETVVLDKNMSVYLEEAGGWLDVSFEPVGGSTSSMLRLMVYSESEVHIEWASNDYGYANAQYSSEDGITFTRTGDASIDTTINILCVNMYAPWNDIVSKFINISIPTYAGLNEYKETTKIKEYFVDPETNICYTLPETFFKNLGLEVGASFYGDALIIMKEADENHVMTEFILATCAGGNMVRRLKYESIDCIAVDDWGSCEIYEFKNNLAVKYLITTWPNVTSLGTNSGYNSGTMLNICDMQPNYKLFGYDTNESNTWYVLTLVNGEATKTEENMNCNHHTITSWVACPTQFTLAKSNEILPGLVALGKDGIVEGDGSIYDNLDTNKIISTYYDLEPLMINAGITSPKLLGLPNSRNLIVGRTNFDIGKTYYLEETTGDDYDCLVGEGIMKYYSTETEPIGTTYVNKSLTRKIVASGTNITIYNLKTGDLIKTLTRSAFISSSYDFEIYGDLLIYTRDLSVYIYDTNTDIETNLNIPALSTSVSWSSQKLTLQFANDRYLLICRTGYTSSATYKQGVGIFVYDLDDKTTTTIVNITSNCSSSTYSSNLYPAPWRCKDNIYFTYRIYSSSNATAYMYKFVKSTKAVSQVCTRATRFWGGFYDNNYFDRARSGFAIEDSTYLYKSDDYSSVMYVTPKDGGSDSNTGTTANIVEGPFDFDYNRISNAHWYDNKLFGLIKKTDEGEPRIYFAELEILNNTNLKLGIKHLWFPKDVGCFVGNYLNSDKLYAYQPNLWTACDLSNIYMSRDEATDTIYIKGSRNGYYDLIFKKYKKSTVDKAKYIFTKACSYNFGIISVPSDSTISTDPNTIVIDENSNVSINEAGDTLVIEEV